GRGVLPRPRRRDVAAVPSRGRWCIVSANVTTRAAGNTIIAGIGQTEFSKASGRSELQLAAEASLAAITDAGLTPADIDGMVTFTLDTNDELLLMRCLGIPEVRYWSRTPYGGAGGDPTGVRRGGAGRG